MIAWLKIYNIVSSRERYIELNEIEHNYDGIALR